AGRRAPARHRAGMDDPRPLPPHARGADGPDRPRRGRGRGGLPRQRGTHDRGRARPARHHRAVPGVQRRRAGHRGRPRRRELTRSGTDAGGATSPAAGSGRGRPPSGQRRRPIVWGVRAGRRPEGTVDSARRWGAVVALAIGIFVLITIEELPIGVLSVMAPDLGVSEGVAGLAVTVPGILAGVVALCTPVLVRVLDRRLVLVLALAAVVVSCALSVLAPTFAVLLLARLFAGIAIGLYWAVMAIVALGQVPAEHAARALTIAFG